MISSLLISLTDRLLSLHVVGDVLIIFFVFVSVHPATTPTATTANPPSSKYLLRVRDYGKVLTRDIHSLLTTPEWSLSVLLVHVNAQTLFKIVNLLLMEKSLIIYGRNAGVVTAVTLGRCLHTTMRPCIHTSVVEYTSVHMRFERDILSFDREL